jgi:anti-repressor protein
MNKLQIFNNDKYSIRITVGENEEPLFIASDVCKELDISNPTDAIRRLDDDESTLVSIEGASNGLPVNAVTESGLYSLVLGSRKPEAKEFKRWITHDVIPSIRKHGAYATPVTIENIISNPEFGIELLKSLKSEQDKNKALEAKNTEMKPKALFADAVSTSHTSVLIGDLAKILRGNNIEIGQKRLFQWLRDNNYIIKSGSSKNMPTQKSMELGLMQVKEGSYINGNGQNITTKTTKITGKGQIYFVNKFLGNED